MIAKWWKKIRIKGLKNISNAKLGDNKIRKSGAYTNDYFISLREFEKKLEEYKNIFLHILYADNKLWTHDFP